MLTNHDMQYYAGTSWQLTMLTWTAMQRGYRRSRSSWPLQRDRWRPLRSGRAMPLPASPLLR